MIRRRTRCLGEQTITALAHGKIPIAEVPQIESHLLHCPRCVAAIAAGMRSRTCSGPIARRGHGPMLVRSRSRRGQVLRGLAVALSLLALGGSATWWYLEPGPPPKSGTLPPVALPGLSQLTPP